MAADLKPLVPEFRKKVEALVANCAKRGIEMRPNEALRDPWRQARLWRQSRAIQEITAAIGKLQSDGAPYLAGILTAIGPQHGPNVTNSLPGFSWHQWGEACDCFWVVDGHAEWNTVKKIDGQNGYRVYAEEAGKLGLDAGGLWTSFKDWPHVQFQPAASPRKLFSVAEIDTKMRARWGTTPPKV